MISLRDAYSGGRFFVRPEDIVEVVPSQTPIFSCGVRGTIIVLRNGKTRKVVNRAHEILQKIRGNCTGIHGDCANL